MPPPLSIPRDGIQVGSGGGVQLGYSRAAFKISVGVSPLPLVSDGEDLGWQRAVGCVNDGAISQVALRTRQPWARFRNQDKGVLANGGFFGVQCRSQGNKKYPRTLGPAVHLALRAPQPTEAYILQNPPPENPLFLVPERCPQPEELFMFHIPAETTCGRIKRRRRNVPFHAQSPQNSLLVVC